MSEGRFRFWYWFMCACFVALQGVNLLAKSSKEKNEEPHFVVSCPGRPSILHLPTPLLAIQRTFTTCAISPSVVVTNEVLKVSLGGSKSHAISNLVGLVCRLLRLFWYTPLITSMSTKSPPYLRINKEIWHVFEVQNGWWRTRHHIHVKGSLSYDLERNDGSKWT